MKVNMVQHPGGCCAEYGPDEPVVIFILRAALGSKVKADMGMDGAKLAASCQ